MESNSLCGFFNARIDIDRHIIRTDIFALDDQSGKNRGHPFSARYLDSLCISWIIGRGIIRPGHKK
jgi:hypothetical protein